ncbi:MAG: hypothetical protein U9N53_01830, partial [Bacteroidota bacterium]|nr:hypothetical protein [Bacteroidota bacterium]
FFINQIWNWLKNEGLTNFIETCEYKDVAYWPHEMLLCSSGYATISQGWLCYDITVFFFQLFLVVDLHK